MPNIYIIGDSTAHTNNCETYPQVGWGQVFHNYISDDYHVINLAENGRSSKSFKEEGLFKECEENIKQGDYLIIEFGHNDEKEDTKRHTEPFSSYQEYLSYYIDVALNKKAFVILLSPIYRRVFDESGNLKLNNHFDYPKACFELAKKKGILYIDMCKLTYDWLASIGEIKSRKYFMYFKANRYKNYKEGKKDNTHLRLLGAKKVCSLLICELRKNNLFK